MVLLEQSTIQHTLHSHVQLYRYTDPVMGPRLMPDCTKPLAGLTPITQVETTRALSFDLCNILPCCQLCSLILCFAL